MNDDIVHGALSARKYPKKANTVTKDEVLLTSLVDSKKKRKKTFASRKKVLIEKEKKSIVKRKTVVNKKKVVVEKKKESNDKKKKIIEKKKKMGTEKKYEKNKAVQRNKTYPSIVENDFEDHVIMVDIEVDKN